MVEKNYPAAHSMDTYWFATDHDGNLAIFDTGEDGPLPKEAVHNADGFYYLMASIAKDENGISHFYFWSEIQDTFLSLDLLKKEIEYQNKDAEYYFEKMGFDNWGSTIIEFASENGFNYLQKRGTIVKLHATRNLYYFSEYLPSEVYELYIIHEIKGMTTFYMEENKFCELAQLFFYDTKPQLKFGRGIANYYRSNSPANPMNIKILPKDLQQKFILQLPIAFNTKETYQPIQNFKSLAIGSYYLDEDGAKIEFNQE